MVSNITGTVTWGDIRGFSTVFLYNEFEAIFGQTTTTTLQKIRHLSLRIGQLVIDVLGRFTGSPFFNSFLTQEEWLTHRINNEILVLDVHVSFVYPPDVLVSQ